jgi:hypothetical protein
METTIKNTVQETPKKDFKIATLEEVLAYKFDNLLYKFMENFDVTFEEADELFMETKKWLWLCGQPTKDVRMAIQHDMVMLDEMWHGFILFTREYMEFGRKYFGKYLHHAPTTKDEKDKHKEEREKDPKKGIEEYKEKLTEQMGYVYDMLGEESVVKWYEFFPQKYSREKIRKLRRK